MTSLALLDTLSVGNLVKADSGLSQYFAEQFANLTPMKMVIALLMGFVVSVLRWTGVFPVLVFECCN